MLPPLQKRPNLKRTLLAGPVFEPIWTTAQSASCAEVCRVGAVGQAGQMSCAAEVHHSPAFGFALRSFDEVIIWRSYGVIAAGE
jgi:hypothetical protein